MVPDETLLVRDTAELDALYGEALERSVKKQMAQLDDLCRQFIAVSPMVMLGTAGDVSPRGDVPGFVKVADDKTLLVPDRRGNNRIDSLRNIVNNGQVGLLFLVPGVDETLRVNGHAVISKDPSLTNQFEYRGTTPKTVLVIQVTEVYIHCSRALVRSDLWNPAKHAPKGTVPSFGTMLEAHTKGFVEAKAVDEDLITRVPTTLY